MMAFSDAATVEAWLARGPAAKGAAEAAAAIPEIRRRGFAVTLATPEWRTLTGSTRRPVAVVAARRRRCGPSSPPPPISRSC